MGVQGEKNLISRFGKPALRIYGCMSKGASASIGLRVRDEDSGSHEALAHAVSNSTAHGRTTNGTSILLSSIQALRRHKYHGW